ncbi:MAG: hypothetical protein PGN16_10690 [Sphingomonas phyllosphaerae]|uniref:hypothetical protein n=1 Tax=Sphingomonas phyllosphaerae TaxID=257003 RepID=UPI002FF750E5
MTNVPTGISGNIPGAIDWAFENRRDAAAGLSAPIDKLFRNMQRARDVNPFSLPNYGAGPTAGEPIPSITWASTGASGTVARGSVNTGDLQQYIRSESGIYTLDGSGAAGFPVVSTTIANVPNGSGKGGTVTAVSIMTDELTPSFRMPYNPAVKYIVLVQDQFLGTHTNATTSGATAARAPDVIPNGNSGGNQNCILTFPTRKLRKITFISELNWKLLSVWVKDAAQLYPPQNVDQMAFACVTDSYGAYVSKSTVPNSFGFFNVASMLMTKLGASFRYNLGVAGTGFDTDGGDGKRYNDPPRLADIAAVHALTPLSGILGFGSINERNMSPAAAAAGAVRWVSSARSILGPAVPIFVSGTSSGGQGVGTAPSSAILDIEKATFAAVAGLSDPLVAVLPISTLGARGLFNGDGATGSSPGNVQSDLIHLTFGADPGLANSVVGGNELMCNVLLEQMQLAASAMRR